MFASIKAEYPRDNYSIYLSDNLISNLEEYLVNFDENSILLVVDNYFRRSETELSSELNNLCLKYKCLYLEGGIETKNIQAAIKICEELSLHNISRDGCIVAIGGGVVGDICGLSASLYKRGINLVHVPTTMTSVVDSAIGGKTGVNMHETVNLLGTYYHPISTFIDMRFLISLPTRDFAAGVAESIKKSFIYDKNFYLYLLENSKKILSRDLKILFELIYRSIAIKLHHTTSDEREKSRRLLLNYGHTFGQAIESFYGIDEKKLRHGEAVSLGMMCAAKLSECIYKNNNIISQHKDILYEFNLPTKLSECKNLKMPSLKVLVDNLNKDKKKTSKGNRFIICEKLGSARSQYIQDGSLINQSFECVLL